MGLPQTESSTPGAGARTGADWFRWALLVVQVALVALAVDQFQIGSRAFGTVTFLALGGYVVHSLLPVRFRHAFFALLSLSGAVLVLGPETGLWLIALGFALIGLAHLKLQPRALAALMLVVCAALMVARAGLVEVPWSGALWPILGGMFMFRMIVFLYDRKHGERADSIWETISYFFLLPNICFPLFPVVDYKTFRRSSNTEDELVCHQTGVRWMTRGLLHLLLYRFIYYYGVISPDEVSTPLELAQYLVANIALYLRVSGTFHVVIGMLRIFGYALPETHFMYFASASINDFWRRANIYWKDFMLKVCYFPTYFKLRRKGETRALIVSTVIVVAVTWVLHSYQWFWIRSTFPVKWQDGFFWCALGVLMIINTMAENRKTGARGRRARKWSVNNAFGQAWRIALTFSFLCVSWSLWSCESWEAWFDMVRMKGTGVAETSLATASLVLPALLVVNLLEGLAGRLIEKKANRRPISSAFFGLASVTALILIGTPSVYNRLGASFSDTAQNLRIAKLNRLDAASLERGYYEDLLDVDRFNPELWRAYKAKPASWLQLHKTPAFRVTDGFLMSELVPSMVTPYKGATLRINQWGFRDAEYTLEKPANTTRVALVGASYVMGSGVENEQTFDSVLEEQLNANGPGVPERKYEVHNWGVGGYSPIQRSICFEERALEFDPDVVIYVAHENESFRLIRHLVAARSKKVPLPAGLARLFEENGVDVSAAVRKYEAELEALVPKMLEWTWTEMVRIARERGVKPVWVFLPTLELHAASANLAWMRDIARDAGFEIIDLYDVYDGEDMFALRIADWDYHPNAAGHRLIGERLWKELAARPEVFE